MYGDRFARFQRARRRQDPEGKFLNAFAARVLGIAAEPPRLAEADQAA